MPVGPYPTDQCICWGKQEAAMAVRRVTWLVWAVHLNFLQAFDDSVRAQQAFLARLLPELALASQVVFALFTKNMPD